MNRIGFKTQYMEREERMPVLYDETEEQKAQSEADADELITAMMRQRIRKQAIGLVDDFLRGGLLIDYVKAELKDLQKLYHLTDK